MRLKATHQLPCSTSSLICCIPGSTNANLRAHSNIVRLEACYRWLLCLLFHPTQTLEHVSRPAWLSNSTNHPRRRELWYATKGLRSSHTDSSHISSPVLILWLPTTLSNGASTMDLRAVLNNPRLNCGQYTADLNKHAPTDHFVGCASYQRDIVLLQT